MTEPTQTDQELFYQIEACQHEYYDGYYGVQCTKCPLFYHYGGEPWIDGTLDWDEDDGLDWDDLDY